MKKFIPLLLLSVILTACTDYQLETTKCQFAGPLKGYDSSIKYIKEDDVFRFTLKDKDSVTNIDRALVQDLYKTILATYCQWE